MNLDNIFINNNNDNDQQTIDIKTSFGEFCIPVPEKNTYNILLSVAVGGLLVIGTVIALKASSELSN